MLDRYNREITYLRISVTDRCNLRCRYCMPEQGADTMAKEDILSFETITKVAKQAARLGVKRIRLTGGEPLIRTGIVQLVSLISDIKQIEEVTLTTNGILLPTYAKALKEAGLSRVNISLDTLDKDKFKWLTRGGELTDVLNGIEAAKKAKLWPIKLNCVVRDSSDEPDARSVKEFAKLNGLNVRYIHQMNMATGHFSQVEGGDGGNCLTCNRLRLTANGDFKPCLFNEAHFNIRYGIVEAMQQAIESKPQSGTYNKSGKFYQIGG